MAGERFHMVQNVSMAVHHIGREPTFCKVLNSTLITCPSPGALSNASAPVDFFINGRAYADEAAEELLDPAEAQRGSRFRLDYLPNPQFSTAKREKWIKHHPGEPLTLVIHKEQDSLGLESHEYHIKIGQVSCDIQIISDRVIHCSVNESLGTAEGQLPITIQVGNFNQTIATLQLGGSETAIVVSIVICSVLLLLSVVALFVFCTKSRRAERYWQKTLLQMEEMESQIREEIRKGFAELQTDMTDLTKELNRSQGIPFLEYKHFVTRTFFPKCSSLYEERYVLLFRPSTPRVAPRHRKPTHCWESGTSLNTVGPAWRRGSACSPHCSTTSTSSSSSSMLWSSRRTSQCVTGAAWRPCRSS